MREAPGRGHAHVTDVRRRAVCQLLSDEGDAAAFPSEVVQQVPGDPFDATALVRLREDDGDVGG